MILLFLNFVCAKSIGSSKVNIVTVIRNGDSLFIRTSYDETRDLVQYLDVFATAVIGDNKPMNFKATYLIPKTNMNLLSVILNEGVLIHNTSDDTSPYYFNGNRSGGNIGFGDMRLVTCVGHDKTVEDVGSEWTDDAGVKWYIMRILNSSTLWMLSENIGSGDLWDFKTTIIGNLKHSTGALHPADIIVSSYTAGQLEPSVSNQSKRAFLNGNDEITLDGVYTCDSLRILDVFCIPDLSESLDSVKAKVGSSIQPSLNLGNSHLSVEVIYDFDGYGGCCIESKITGNKAFSTPCWGNIQSYCLNKGNYDSLFVYMPNVKVISDSEKDWDLNKLTSLNEGPVSSLNFYQTSWENSEVPPYRMVQYLGNDKNHLDVGFSHGYSQTFGDSRPKIRKNNVSLAWTLASFKKSLPYSIYTSDIEASDFIQIISAFRCYFKPQNFSKNATDAYWYKEKGYNTLMLDYQKIALSDTISLPTEFDIKGLQVIDKSSSLVITSGDSIQNNLIVIDSNTDHSYAVLRLFDYIPELPDSTESDSLYLRMPECIYTTTASKYSLYYNNTVLTKKPENYSFIVNCPVGYEEGNKYNLDSLEAGRYSLSLDVYDLFGTLLESASSQLIVTDKSIGLEDTLRILYVGDSKTYSGKAQRDCQLLLESTSSMPIKFLGTKYNIDYPEYGIDYGLFHEGIPGFSWRKFAGYNESSFVFEDGDYWNVYPDCKRYFNELLHGEKPDLVLFFIGIVDIFSCVTTDINDIEAVDIIINDILSQTNMGKLIDSMEVALPEAKFGVSLIPPGNIREESWNYQWGDSARAWCFKNAQHRLVQRYIDRYKQLGKTRFSMMPLYLNFDSYLGYDSNECIHPNAYGCKQESETVFAWIKFQIDQMTKIEDKDQSITEYKLFQNYPNPFNPTTTINYSLQKDSKIKLQIYDLKGSQIVTLVDQKQKAGNYKIDFNGNGFTSGVYFYVLEIEGRKVQSRKMLLLK
jgi:hypothetical protein